MGFGTFGAGDKVKRLPFSVAVVKFYGAFPKHVDWQYNGADDERPVERAEEVFC